MFSVYLHESRPKPKELSFWSFDALESTLREGVLPGLKSIPPGASLRMISGPRDAQADMPFLTIRTKVNCKCTYDYVTWD